MTPHPTLLKTLQKEPPEINLPRKWNPGRRMIRKLKSEIEYWREFTKQERSL